MRELIKQLIEYNKTISYLMYKIEKKDKTINELNNKIKELEIKNKNLSEQMLKNKTKTISSGLSIYV